MPEERKKNEKLLCVDNLRHAEYYGMQQVFDGLYAKSKAGELFPDLMDIILSRENILLAYRNIKTNTGSKTAGTDGLTMADIGNLTPDQVIGQVRFIIAGSPHGYRPRAVRRKDIPKPNGTTRPLGIPCIWDRLVQQCIKQVMEPICEAKFSDNSYGFRPNRSVEHAIARTYQMLQLSHLHYVIEFDIKGFFDNVNHVKLIKQIWAMGIQDKHLIWVIKRILKARIKMPNGTFVTPDKGTPQGGIISPLLANIVLNELDHWVDSQWTENPQILCRSHNYGHINKGYGYTVMRGTKLKEMYIVRYADDFRIFCRTKTDAEKAKIAITQWLNERLKLEVSEEKTRVVNVKRKFSEFLGFKIKVHQKGQRQVVMSHISDKQLKRARNKLVEQAKRVAIPPKGSGEQYELRLYNSMVTGIQNYYRIATNVSVDCAKLNRSAMTVFTNRLRMQRGSRLVKTGRPLTEVERKQYGKSQMLRFVAGSEEPIYPIGYIRHKNPMGKKRCICQYTIEGRKGLHDNLRINVSLMRQLMRQPLYDRSAEYADNRISMFSAQWGKCAVTGKDFQTLADIHCHHKIPRHMDGSDKYENLILVLKPMHKLIHATQTDTIRKYLFGLNLDKDELRKLDELRTLAGLSPLTNR
jgi:group II intron reverse transcriptase/maturase